MGSLAFGTRLQWSLALVLAASGCIQAPALTAAHPSSPRVPPTPQLDPGFWDDAPQPTAPASSEPRPPPANAAPPSSARPSLLTGILVDINGSAVPGATVWLEPFDLQRPVNNLASFLETVNATRTSADARGRFAIDASPGRYFVVAEAPGLLRVRSGYLTLGAGSHIRLALPPFPDAIVIAHRGASQAAPENTLASFRKAVAMGADAVEMDLQLTRDNQIAIMHDDTIDRTTNGRGRVRDYNLTDLARFDAGGWFDRSFAGERIPSLKEALSALRGQPVTVYLDLKSRTEDLFETETQARLLVESLDMEAQVLYTSFQQHTMAFCAAAANQRCGYIVDQSNAQDDAIGVVTARRWQTLLFNRNLVNVARVQAAHQNSQRLDVWTVNEPLNARAFLEIGVDGIITNEPQTMRGVLATWSETWARHSGGVTPPLVGG